MKNSALVAKLLKQPEQSEVVCKMSVDGWNWQIMKVDFDNTRNAIVLKIELPAERTGYGATK